MDAVTNDNSGANKALQAVKWTPFGFLANKARQAVKGAVNSTVQNTAQQEVRKRLNFYKQLANAGSD